MENTISGLERYSNRLFLRVEFCLKQNRNFGIITIFLKYFLRGSFISRISFFNRSCQRLDYFAIEMRIQRLGRSVGFARRKESAIAIPVLIGIKKAEFKERKRLPLDETVPRGEVWKTFPGKR